MSFYPEIWPEVPQHFHYPLSLQLWINWEAVTEEQFLTLPTLITLIQAFKSVTLEKMSAVRMRSITG